MRIAIGGFCHETNMFGNVLIDMELLERGTKEGAELIRTYTGKHSYVGGFIDEAEALGVEVVPTRMSSFKPSGPCVPEGPVLINESSDNPGGGTPGDGTHLLRELLRGDVPSAFGYIYDPEVVAQAMEAGVGATIDCCLGGKTDKFHGEPIEIRGAYVKHISDGIFTRVSPMGKGGLNDLGMTVYLVVGNVHIVVGGGPKNGVPAIRTQTFDDGPFRVVGADWQHTRVLALKSSQRFKGWWKDQVKKIIPCDSPGLMSADLTTFPFQYLDKGYFPFEDARWETEESGK